MVKRFARPLGIAAFGAVTGLGILAIAAAAMSEFCDRSLWGGDVSSKVPVPA